MPPEFGGKLGTKSLNTKFPGLISPPSNLLCMSKAKKKNNDILLSSLKQLYV